jgi:hypothetical protein
LQDPRSGSKSEKTVSKHPHTSLYVYSMHHAYNQSMRQMPVGRKILSS